MMAQHSRTDDSTETRWWLVRSSKNLALFYCLSRRGHGPIRCECEWARRRERSNKDLKVCRHVMAVLNGGAREARPVRRAVVAEPMAIIYPEAA